MNATFTITREGWVKRDGTVVGGISRDVSSENMRLWAFTKDTRPGVAPRWRNGYRTRAEAIEALKAAVAS